MQTFGLTRQLVHARARRRFQRGLKRKPLTLLKKLRKTKKEAAPNEKPATVKTHLRNMIIVPEMIGSVCGVYVSAFPTRSSLVSRQTSLITLLLSTFFSESLILFTHPQNGKSFVTVEIKPEMTGHYLGEFS